MASVHRRIGSKYWVAAYRLPDGTRVQRSTRLTRKSDALQVALAAEKVARRRMGMDAARALLWDVVRRVGGDCAAEEKLSEFCVRWIARRRGEVRGGTADRYAQALGQFVEAVGPDVAGAPVSDLTAADVSRWRDGVARRTSAANANALMKVLSAALADAEREGLAPVNVAGRVRSLRIGAEKSGRRAMTVEEVRRVLAAAPPEGEWHGMILLGVYTGQRLGDIARLRWADVADGWWRFPAGKTGRSMAVPLAEPVKAWLAGRKRGKAAWVFPEAVGLLQAAKGKTGTLSNRFHELLARAGMVERRAHRSRGIGRSAKRTSAGLSFHCLRHTANSLLKAAGVSESVAMALIGHSSKAVSQVYTHLPEETLAKAVRRLKM
jgi:integrase